MKLIVIYILYGLYGGYQVDVAQEVGRVGHQKMSLHVQVSLDKILNSKLLIKAPTISVQIYVKCISSCLMI